MTDRERERNRMVNVQITARGIRDAAVIEAMRKVPREEFVDSGYEEFAYEDTPLPIDEEQTISQPYIVALMLEAAGLTANSRVLEVGAGSGYAAALLSRIAKRVYAIERHPSLAESARRRFERLGYDNIQLRTGDGTNGWPQAAPFDAILVSAAGESVPQPLRDQLGMGGHLVIPVSENRRSQRLRKITRLGKTEFQEEDLGAVSFVPLVCSDESAEDGRRTYPFAL